MAPEVGAQDISGGREPDLSVTELPKFQLAPGPEKTAFISLV